MTNERMGESPASIADKALARARELEPTLQPGDVTVHPGFGRDLPEVVFHRTPHNTPLRIPLANTALHGDAEKLATQIAEKFREIWSR